MTSKTKWILAALIICLVLGGGLLIAFIALAAMFGVEDRDFGSLSDRVGVLKIEGVIEEAQQFNRQLRKFRKDKSVRAVVVRINSPGGAVAPSQEMYEALRRFRDETEKPVIVSLGSIAASGGYLVACAADSILTSAGTLTGSIGVILEFPNLQEVLRKVGIGFEVVKSGEKKDIGSPWRSLTDEERRLLQQMVDDVYEQFVELVSAERSLPMDSTLAMADGRVFSGRQAVSLGLADRTGTLQDAIDLAGLLCGLGKDPKTVTPKKKRTSLRDFLTETIARVKEPAAALGTPRLQYIFR